MMALASFNGQIFMALLKDALRSCYSVQIVLNRLTDHPDTWRLCYDAGKHRLIRRIIIFKMMGELLPLPP